MTRNFVDEFLNFIHTDKFKVALSEESYCISVEMLDFMLNCNGIANRLSRFLVSINLDKIESKKKDIISNPEYFVFEVVFFMVGNAKNTKEAVFYLFAHMINDEIEKLRSSGRINKKFLTDLERLNKFQREIIEKYYFKDTIENFFKKIGAKRKYLQKERLSDLCEYFGEFLENAYVYCGKKDYALRILKDFFNIKIESDRIPVFREVTKGILTFIDILDLIPLLKAYSGICAPKRSGSEDAIEALTIINDFYGLGLKYQIGRNEFQSAVKECYNAYLENQQKLLLTKNA